jgi:hypothetical protein
MNPDISAVQLLSFLFQCVTIVTMIWILAMILMEFGSATSSQTPFMASFMQKSVKKVRSPQNQIW